MSGEFGVFGTEKRKSLIAPGSVIENVHEFVVIRIWNEDMLGNDTFLGLISGLVRGRKTPKL